MRVACSSLRTVRSTHCFWHGLSPWKMPSCQSAASQRPASKCAVPAAGCAKWTMTQRLLPACLEVEVSANRWTLFNGRPAVALRVSDSASDSAEGKVFAAVLALLNRALRRVCATPPYGRIFCVVTIAQPASITHPDVGTGLAAFLGLLPWRCSRPSFG